MCPPLGGWELGSVSLGSWVDDPDDEFPISSSSPMAAGDVFADGRIMIG